jgi:glycosyltransferase involved in cell wall biosynthesis
MPEYRITMNIAIFCKTLLKGGTEKQALMLSKLLAGQKTDVLLINWCSNKIDKENLGFIKNNSIKYVALKGNLFRKFFDFLKIIRDEKISFILSYLTLPNFVSGISKLFVKNVTRIGGIRNEKLPYYKFILEMWIHNNLNNATVFNNYAAKDKFIKRGFKSSKIIVIQNAIITDHKNGKEREPRSEIKIVTVSRFVKQKDFRTALYAFNELNKRNKDKALTYYLVGYGPMEQEIRSLSRDLKITERIKIFINPSDIIDILTECDIYLSTSLFEGFSNSIMEAMVAGLPIVATDVGDNKYLIKDGFNGFIVPCKNIGKIVEKLELLSESEDLRNDFGNNSRILIENKFSREKFLEDYLNLFSEIQHY